MNAASAISTAKQYVREMFAEESLSNLGLEEIEFDDGVGVWSVTVGFSRPWEFDQGLRARALGEKLAFSRTYKTVKIRDEDGSVLSVRNREIQH